MPSDFGFHSVFKELYKLNGQYLFQIKCLLLKLDQTGRGEELLFLRSIGFQSHRDPEHKEVFLLFQTEMEMEMEMNRIISWK